VCFRSNTRGTQAAFFPGMLRKLRRVSAKHIEAKDEELSEDALPKSKSSRELLTKKGATSDDRVLYVRAHMPQLIDFLDSSKNVPGGDVETARESMVSLFEHALEVDALVLALVQHEVGRPHQVLWREDTSSLVMLKLALQPRVLVSRSVVARRSVTLTSISADVVQDGLGGRFPESGQRSNGSGRRSHMGRVLS
jgi:hypothetical protein